MVEVNEIASGFRFPEGPIYMDDGSVVLVEIARQTVTRVSADGDVDIVAETGGGPNGAALGPDGKVWVANNGNAFDYKELDGGMLEPTQPPSNHEGGRIERVDLDSGEVERVYEESDGRPLIAPNDLVFDEHGGFWFTDHGIRHERTSDRTGVFYAKADGSEIREVIHPLEAPNGIGLSPGGDRLYVAETYTCRVWWWDVTGPGEVKEVEGILPHGGTILGGVGGFVGFDSLAVDGEGYVCPATLLHGGITAFHPEDGSSDFFELGDPLTTNICFGGDDMRTAYATLSASGKLVSFEWPRPGLRLAHQ